MLTRSLINEGQESQSEKGCVVERKLDQHGDMERGRNGEGRRGQFKMLQCDKRGQEPGPAGPQEASKGKSVLSPRISY